MSSFDFERLKHDTVFLVMFILLCKLQPTFGTWQFSGIGVTSNHILIRNQDVQHVFFARDTIILKSIDNKFVLKWISPSDCLLSSEDNQTSFLQCFKIGLYNIGIQRNCSSCPANDTQVFVRIDESSNCFFWNATAVIRESYADLQLSVSAIRNSYAKNEKRNASFVYNDLFHSRRQHPVIESAVKIPFSIISSSYNLASRTWNFRLNKSEFLNSSFVKVTSNQYSTVTGCSVSTTFIHFHREHAQQPAFMLPLKGISGITSVPVFHPCFPDRVVLITNESVYFTHDDFSSFSTLNIPTWIASNYGVEVSDAAVGMAKIFIILKGKLFFASIFDKKLQFQRLHVEETETDRLVGLTTSSVCLRSPHISDVFTWESTFVLSWSDKKIFISNALFGNGNGQWKTLQFSREYLGATVLSLRLETSTQFLRTLVFHRSSLNLLDCLILNNYHLSCTSLALHAIFLKGLIFWEFLNTAQSSSIIWNGNQVGYDYDDGEVEGIFTEVSSIKQVVLNADHNKWLIVTENNSLFYGSGKTRSLTKLRRIDLPESENFVYKFRRVDNKVIRISWDNVTVKSEVYPLLSELYGALQNATPQQQFCDYFHFSSNLFHLGGNVRNLEGAGERISLSIKIAYPARSNVDITMKSSFSDVVVIDSTKTTLSTHVIPGRPVMRVKSVETVLASSCSDTSGQCLSGIALFEVQVATEASQPLCLLPLTQVLFINISCPAGLHIRVKVHENSSGCNNLSRDADCHFLLGYPYSIYLTVDLYRYDERLSTIRNNVELTEINKRTGFQIQDKNLILKDCFLCSEFIETNSSSKIILQTGASACPCKPDKYDPDRWIGNVSFYNSDSPPDATNNTNAYLLHVKVLGNSYCNLTAMMSIELQRSPVILVDYWEVISIFIFVCLTVIVLVVSYSKYHIHMKALKQEKVVVQILHSAKEGK